MRGSFRVAETVNAMLAGHVHRSRSSISKERRSSPSHTDTPTGAQTIWNMYEWNYVQLHSWNGVILWLFH